MLLKRLPSVFLLLVLGLWSHFALSLSVGRACGVALRHVTMPLAYPLFKLIQLDYKLMHRTEGATQLFGKNDLWHAAAYLFLVGLSQSSQVPEVEGYEAALEELKRNKSAVKPRILYVSGSDDAYDEGYSFKMFKEKFLDAHVADVDYLINNDSLEKKLSDFKKEGKVFDLIVFSGHGSPGDVDLPGERVRLNTETLEKYSKDIASVMNEDTVLITQGCNSFLGRSGERLAQEMARQLNPAAVIGAQKLVTEQSRNLNDNLSYFVPGFILARNLYLDKQSKARPPLGFLMYSFQGDWVVMRRDTNRFEDVSIPEAMIEK